VEFIKQQGLPPEIFKQEEFVELQVIHNEEVENVEGLVGLENSLGLNTVNVVH
jgi:hypothetical protein